MCFHFFLYYTSGHCLSKVLYNSCFFLLLGHVIQKTKDTLHKLGFIVFHSKKKFLYNE